MTIAHGAGGQPKLSWPRIMLVVTDKIVPIGGEELLTWSVGGQHPFIPEMRIVAVFKNGDDVEIYSSVGTEKGIRDTVPGRFIRFTREAMPFDVWAEELAYAELGGDDDEAGDDEGYEGEPTNGPPVTATPNTPAMGPSTS
jgi:hypothetical protein